MHQRRVRACVRAKWLEVVVSAYQAPLPTGILQTIMLEWVALPSSRGSSRPSGFFTTSATWEAPERSSQDVKSTLGLGRRN